MKENKLELVFQRDDGFLTNVIIATSDMNKI